MKDFETQPFYKKLKSQTIRDTIKILSSSRYKNIFKFTEYLLYSIALFLICLTIPSFKGNFDTTSFIILGIAMALVILLLPMIKASQENYKKLSDVYRDNLSKPVCNCPVKCTCKDDLKEYLKSKKVTTL